VESTGECGEAQARNRGSANAVSPQHADQQARSSLIHPRSWPRR
jgi:hypothetical protein